MKTIAFIVSGWAWIVMIIVGFIPVTHSSLELNNPGIILFVFVYGILAGYVSKRIFKFINK